tara:strand:- start:40 stop:276 length:237 start_codon:yes stop_codon:yes gene_type:complete
MSWKKNFINKKGSCFKKTGGDPPEKTTSYTYTPGDNSAASRFNSIVGTRSSGQGSIPGDKKPSKGGKVDFNRKVPKKF